MEQLELSNCIADAARSAFAELQDLHSETFYYFTLTTTGEAHAPWPSAWSEEALKRVCAKYDDPDQAKRELRWSYADSPYCGFGEEHFGKVNSMFDQRPMIDDLSDDAWRDEYSFRLRAMESAMRRLDKEGLFGSNEDRDRCTIHVEVMPPDVTNTECAIRLNSQQALANWLNEVAGG